jgi:hypothetical protein
LLSVFAATAQSGQIYHRENRFCTHFVKKALLLADKSSKALFASLILSPHGKIF